MDKMKRYLDCYIPTETCNFKCHYCYIAQNNKFNNKIVNFKYSPDYIAKALSKERLGGTCLINLCAGGETLIAEEVVDVVRAILEEGHYVMVVTNGSLTQRFEKIAKFPKDLLKHLFFKFSFHYQELLRLKILDRYFNNIRMMQEAGASFTIEITPSDEQEAFIDEIKEVMMKEMGALPHITIGRKDSGDIPPLTDHKFEDYLDIWEKFESPLISFKKTIFGEKRKEFCYAGEWTGYLNLVDGTLSQCYCGKVIDNIYEDIERPIKFLPIGCNCTMPHCYNGHSFLSFGDIPEMETPTYDVLRNRVQLNGKEWLQPEMKAFMQSKLVDSNKEYSDKEKELINKKNKKMLMSSKIKNKVKSIISKNK